jgi:DNA-binding MarR family transcriptional regulator
MVRKRIEEEIQQDKFSSAYQKSVINILVTAHVVYARMNRFLKAFDLSQEQYNVLRILRGQKGKPVGVLLIQERMMDKMSNASRLVDKLEHKELVVRKQSKEDRRQVEITITENGMKKLADIDASMNFFDDNDFNPDDFEAFNQMLDEIRERFK